MTVRILLGDCREVLKTLPDNSVQCCVTSPPYWGLRSYLPEDHANKHLEIGSEPTLQHWVDTMVDVFREVRRVLRPDGTLFLNLGDAYAGGGRGGNVGNDSSGLAGKQTDHSRGIEQGATGLKPKDMMGQPWRVAFALQDDGWWLRQEIIWHKPNPMPESARDRCTKAHEHVFLLTKSERYVWDFEAMQEPVSPATHARLSQDVANQVGSTRAHAGGKTNGTMKAVGRGTTARNNGVGFGHGYDANPKPRTVATPKAALASSGNDGAYEDGASERMGRGAGWRTKNNASMDEALAVMPDTRNPRSVWTIPTHGFKGAHFATFPPALAERCITAGCPPGGVVLDPFGGSGTVGLVADRMHRDAILIDLDERNLPMAKDRITADAPLFAEVTA